MIEQTTRVHVRLCASVDNPIVIHALMDVGTAKLPLQYNGNSGRCDVTQTRLECHVILGALDKILSRDNVFDALSERVLHVLSLLPI